MELNILIEKIDGDIEVPMEYGDQKFQLRSDGVYMNNVLHFWDDILYVHILNKGLLSKLKQEKRSGRS